MYTDLPQTRSFAILVSGSLENLAQTKSRTIMKAIYHLDPSRQNHHTIGLFFFEHSDVLIRGEFGTWLVMAKNATHMNKRGISSDATAYPDKVPNQERSEAQNG